MLLKNYKGYFSVAELEAALGHVYSRIVARAITQG